MNRLYFLHYTVCVWLQPSAPLGSVCENGTPQRSIQCDFLWRGACAREHINGNGNAIVGMWCFAKALAVPLKTAIQPIGRKRNWPLVASSFIHSAIIGGTAMAFVMRQPHTHSLWRTVLVNRPAPHRSRE